MVVTKREELFPGATSGATSAAEKRAKEQKRE